MGLIKAGMGAIGGTLADQWKEFFYCESMPKEVLVTKGQKRVTGRSSNTKGNDNIITTHQVNHLFLREILAKVSKRHSRL